jgi:hypothetical protein
VLRSTDVGYPNGMSIADEPERQPGRSSLDDEDTAIVASYARYDGAQRAVDSLSDAGFDVARSAIVWNGLKRVEHVLGRQTVPTASLKGAGAGAWFAGFFGLLVALFVDTDNPGEVIAIVVTYVLLGAVVGAIWFGVAHWRTGGRRDFTSVGTFEAESYDVRVPIDQRDDAERILGVTRARSIDPPPAGSIPPPPGA